MPVEPLFPFGYGLSYTTFAYSNMKVLTKEVTDGEPVRIEVDVENTGGRVGVETVQLYINDLYSSVTTPVRELKAFQRVVLEPGESKTVQLEIPFAQLALVNAALETVVEPGTFEVMVGSSSRDKDLLKDTFEVK
jgi:beta-glucosidase